MSESTSESLSAGALLRAAREKQGLHIAALAAAITRAQAAGDPDLGATYYRHWLDALESLVIAKGLADANRLHALEHAWEAAAERTPHGQPIELDAAEKALARQ